MELGLDRTMPSPVSRPCPISCFKVLIGFRFTLKLQLLFRTRFDLELRIGLATDMIGRSKLSENNDSSAVGCSPMFRTGLGKSVAVKQSSIAKALRVLGDDDLPRTGKN